MDRDDLIRRAAIAHCQALTSSWGDAVPAAEITRGFGFSEERIKLVAWGRGIFKPEQLHNGPLTLVSSLGSSYNDESIDGGVMLYDYAPSSFSWANEGRKRLGERGRPVILLKQVKAKPRPEYMIFAPVSIVSFDDRTRKFRISLSATEAPSLATETASTGPTVYARRYAETIARVRLHQAYFRRDALAAYRDQCCVCELKERPLLDAAHILADSAEGVASVTNGLALCPTHHRAFDRNVLLVSPDYQGARSARPTNHARVGSHCTYVARL